MNAECKSDWILMSVPGRDDERGNVEIPTAWFAYNTKRRERRDAAIRFATRQEALAFVNHPDNRPNP